jgi:cytochrome c oxidase subunit II
MGTWVPLFPVSASAHADAVDHVYFFLLAVAAFFTLLIFLCIVAFSILYRRGRHPIPHATPKNIGLELFWTAVPFMLTMVMFTWGSKVYMDGETPPKGAQDIYVVGKQWMWKIQHPEGRREINELHVPVNTPIKLTLTSQDVIHSFFLPVFRIKQDALPGQYRTLWFEANRTGAYHLFCAEYCGTNHSKMIGQVIVMEEHDYEAWLSGVDNSRPVESGAKLFVEYDCINCHGTGQRLRCPTLGGLYGTYVKLEGGRSVLFDEDYIRESILEPNAKIAAGFPAAMPTFKGQLNEEQIFDLIAYIKSLSPGYKPNETTEQTRGK